MNMPVEQDLSAVVQRLRMSDVSYFECEGPDFLIRLHFARRPEKSDIRAVPPPPATTVLGRALCPIALLAANDTHDAARMASPRGRAAFRQDFIANPPDWTSRQESFRAQGLGADSCRYCSEA